MRILFADAGGVCRYSTILLAKESEPSIKVFEADTLYRSKLMMFSEAIDLLFINANLICRKDIEQIRNIRNIKIVLITDCESNSNVRNVLESAVDGVLDLQDSLDSSRLFMEKIIGKFCANNKPEATVKPLKLRKYISEQFSTRLN